MKNQRIHFQLTMSGFGNSRNPSQSQDCHGNRRHCHNFNFNWLILHDHDVMGLNNFHNGLRVILSHYFNIKQTKDLGGVLDKSFFCLEGG